MGSDLRLVVLGDVAGMGFVAPGEFALVGRELSDLVKPQELLSRALQEESESGTERANSVDDDENATPRVSSPTATLPDSRQVKALQRQLAREAGEFALDVARHSGAGSAASQAATQAARLLGRRR